MVRGFFFRGIMLLFDAGGLHNVFLLGCVVFFLNCCFFCAVVFVVVVALMIIIIVSRGALLFRSNRFGDYSLEEFVQFRLVYALGRVLCEDAGVVGGPYVVGVVVGEEDVFLREAKASAERGDVCVLVAEDVRALGAARSVVVVGLRTRSDKETPRQRERRQMGTTRNGDDSKWGLEMLTHEFEARIVVVGRRRDRDVVIVAEGISQSLVDDVSPPESCDGHLRVPVPRRFHERPEGLLSMTSTLALRETYQVDEGALVDADVAQGRVLEAAPDVEGREGAVEVEDRQKGRRRHRRTRRLHGHLIRRTTEQIHPRLLLQDTLSALFSSYPETSESNSQPFVLVPSKRHVPHTRLMDGTVLAAKKNQPPPSNEKREKREKIRVERENTVILPLNEPKKKSA